MDSLDIYGSFDGEILSFCVFLSAKFKIISLLVCKFYMFFWLFCCIMCMFAFLGCSVYGVRILCVVLMYGMKFYFYFCLLGYRFRCLC